MGGQAILWLALRFAAKNKESLAKTIGEWAHSRLPLVPAESASRFVLVLIDTFVPSSQGVFGSAPEADAAIDAGEHQDVLAAMQADLGE